MRTDHFVSVVLAIVLSIGCSSNQRRRSGGLFGNAERLDGSVLLSEEEQATPTDAVVAKATASTEDVASGERTGAERWGSAPLTGDHDPLANPTRMSSGSVRQANAEIPGATGSVRTVLNGAAPDASDLVRSTSSSADRRFALPVNDAAPDREEQLAGRIERVLRALARREPERVDEFARAARTAATSERLEQLLVVWEATATSRIAATSARTPETYGDADRAFAERGSLFDQKPGADETSSVRDDWPQTDGKPLGLPRKLGPASMPSRVPSESTRKITPAPSRPFPGTSSRTDQSEVTTIPRAIAPHERDGGARRVLWESDRYRGEPSLPSTRATPSLPPREPEPVEEPGSFEDQLSRLAHKAETMRGADADEQLRLAVYNRLLHSMAGEKNQAMRPISGADPVDRKYWTGQLWAFDQYFDKNGFRRPEARAGAVLQSLDDAAHALERQADLEVSTPILCSDVVNFGNYREFNDYVFQAGQKIVIYWEVRNFQSKESKEGFRTSMQARFEIFDSQGNPQYSEDRVFGDDVCRNHRRDYFNVALVTLPVKLGAGTYTLKVITTDRNAQKFAEKQRSFKIR